MMTYTIGDRRVITGNVAVKQPDGVVATADGVVVDGPTGAWRATFADGELEQVGWHALEVRVIFAGETLPQTFALDEDDVPMGFFTRAPYA
jgi:hypothetical protein